MVFHINFSLIITFLTKEKLKSSVLEQSCRLQIITSYTEIFLFLCVLKRYAANKILENDSFCPGKPGKIKESLFGQCSTTLLYQENIFFPSEIISMGVRAAYSRNGKN